MNYDKIIDMYNDRSIHKSIPLMEFVVELTSDVSSIRKAAKIPEAYPLISLDLYIGDRLFPLVNDLWFSGPRGGDHFSTPYRDLIQETCNVDEVVFDFTSEWAKESYGLSEDVTIDFRKAGPVFGKDMGRISKAVKSGRYKRVDGGIEVDDIFVSSEYYSFKTKDPDISSGVKTLDGDTFIVLNTNLGFGKPKYVSSLLVKEINSARKTVGADLTSLVDAVVFDSAENIARYKRHDDFIKSKVRASSIEYRVSELGRSVSVGSA